MNLKDPISKIRKTAKVPLHREAELRIRSLISQSEYQDGALLPNEIGLAKDLGISRHTLRQAIGRLVNEGLLVRTAGLGTRVCNQPVRTDVNAWSSFTLEMQRMGIEVVNFSMDVAMVVPSEEMAANMGVDPGVAVLRLRRVRGWEGNPAVVAESWLHPRLGLTGEEDFSGPLYELIQRIGGLPPKRSIEEITVVSATRALAEKLDEKANAPLLLRQRRVFDSRNEVIEVNLNWYRPVSYVLRLELEAVSAMG